MECQQDEVIQGSGVALRKAEVSLIYIVRFCLKTFHICYSILLGGRGRSSRGTQSSSEQLLWLLSLELQNQTWSQEEKSKSWGRGLWIEPLPPPRIPQ